MALCCSQYRWCLHIFAYWFTELTEQRAGRETSSVGWKAFCIHPAGSERGKHTAGCWPTSCCTNGCSCCLCYTSIYYNILKEQCVIYKPIKTSMQTVTLTHHQQQQHLDVRGVTFACIFLLCYNSITPTKTIKNDSLQRKC